MGAKPNAALERSRRPPPHTAVDLLRTGDPQTVVKLLVSFRKLSNPKLSKAAKPSGTQYSLLCDCLLSGELIGILVGLLLSSGLDGRKLIQRTYNPILSKNRETNNPAGTGLAIHFG
jgi:hypothetical protein